MGFVECILEVRDGYKFAGGWSNGFIDVWAWVYGVQTDLSVGGDDAASAYVLCPL